MIVRIIKEGATWTIVSIESNVALLDKLATKQDAIAACAMYGWHVVA